MPPRRRALMAWLLPLLLLVTGGVALWWFVLRDTTEDQVARVLAQAKDAFQLFEYTRAEQLLLEARDMIPADAEGSAMNVGVHHNLGMLYRHQERWEEARDAFVRAASLCGPEANEVRAEELFQIAQIDIHLGRIEPAAENLEAAIAAHPTRKLLHLAMVDLQLKHLKQVVPADSSTSRYLRLCGRTPENLRDVANVYYRHKGISRALELAKEAAAAADTMITAHVIVAKSYWRAGRAQEGLRYHEGPLARYPNALPLWTAKASVLIGAGDFPAALQSADRALALGPQDYDANRVRMMALYNSGHLQQALEQAMTCRKMTTVSKEIHFLESLMARIHGQIQGKIEPPPTAREGGRLPGGS